MGQVPIGGRFRALPDVGWGRATTLSIPRTRVHRAPLTALEIPPPLHNTVMKVAENLGAGSALFPPIVIVVCASDVCGYPGSWTTAETRDTHDAQ